MIDSLASKNSDLKQKIKKMEEEDKAKVFK